MAKQQRFEDPLNDIDPIMEQAYSISEDPVKSENDDPFLDIDTEPKDEFELEKEEDASSLIDQFSESKDRTIGIGLEDVTVADSEDDDSDIFSNYDSEDDISLEEADSYSDEDVSDIEFPTLSEVRGQNVESSLFNNIPVGVSVELGRSQVSLKEVFELTEGAIIELDRLVGEPLDLVVNGQIVAQGEVVAIDNNYGLRVTNIVAKVS